MSQPTARALDLHDEFARTGTVDLEPIHVHRDGVIGRVTFENHEYLNSEDDRSTAALEVAVDLVLLDDAIEVGVLRGGVSPHPKHAGRRIFSSGINLTHLYDGQISLIEFMIERELGAVGKMFRGHDLGPYDEPDLELRREKPFIAAVESFAIGGGCQLLLVMDRVIAQAGSYFSLPARKEGIVPGCAPMRLPRLVGERLTRQAIFFNRAIDPDSPEGRLLADEVVTGTDAMDDAIEHAAAELTSAGTTSLIANRRAMRTTQEPVDTFRRYMSVYAREQAYCLYSPALIDNLERNWDAANRRRPAGTVSRSTMTSGAAT
jgi:thioesterase DpgC